MTTSIALAAGLALAAVFSPAAHADAATAPSASDSHSNYAVVQTVKNNTDQPLTLTAEKTDNGGALQPGYETTIPSGTSAVYTATNHGNGVQLWLTFTNTSGSTFSVDSDTPKVNGNWSTASISGGSGVSITSISIGSGDKPAASVAFDSTTGHCTTSASTNVKRVI